MHTFFRGRNVTGIRLNDSLGLGAVGEEGGIDRPWRRQGAMGRLTVTDAIQAWAFFFALFLFLTSSLKWSFVMSIFAVANAGIVACWFAVSAPSAGRTEEFAAGLRVGAHRGLAVDAPENTLAAFRLAPSLGADTVELDLEFTKDGVPVIFHDDTLDRVTDGRGPIAQTTASDVFRLNAAAHFGDSQRFPFEGIPTLQDAIQLLLSLKLRILIDVTETLVSLFQQHKELYDCAAVCSFFPQVVYDIKRADANILTGHTWRPGFFAYKDIEQLERRYADSTAMHLGAVVLDWLNELVLHTWLWKLTGASLLLAHRAVVSERYVRQWTEKGLQVVVWTSNSRAERRYFLQDLRVPVLTDCLSDFQEELKLIREQENCQVQTF